MTPQANPHYDSAPELTLPEPQRLDAPLLDADHAPMDHLVLILRVKPEDLLKSGGESQPKRPGGDAGVRRQAAPRKPDLPAPPGHTQEFSSAHPTDCPNGARQPCQRFQ